MKKTPISSNFFFLFLAALKILPLQGNELPREEQPFFCQTILASLASSTPALSPVDTGWIDICLGDTLFLSGQGNYPQNAQSYLQSDYTSLFTWDMGDGSELTGKDVYFIYQSPGAYYVNLRITDQMGCKNENRLNLRIRVSGISEPQITTIPGTTICPNSTVSLSAAYENNTSTYYFSQLSQNDSLYAFPDGTDVAVFSVINVDLFSDNDTILNGDEIADVCVNIEHSWMRDLEISLICPSGIEAVLHEHPGNFGGQVFLGEPYESDEGLPVPIPGTGYKYCWNSSPENDYTWIAYSNAFAPFTLPEGSYLPYEPFSSFVGCPLNGPWTLKVIDFWSIDNGTMSSWSINLNASDSGNNNAESFNSEIIDFHWLEIPGMISISPDSIAANLSASTDFVLQSADNRGCLYFDTTQVIVLPANSDACDSCDSLIANAGPDLYTDCSGETLINASNSSSGDFINYYWTYPNGGTEQTIEPVFSTYTTGEFILTVENTIMGCLSRDTVQVLLSTTLVADAGEDITLDCYADSLVLNGAGSSSGSGIDYLWTTPNGHIVSGNYTISATINESGNYILAVRLNSSCVVRDTVLISIPPSVISDITTVSANCDASDGSATVTLFPGNTNVAFEWNNQQNTQTATGLAQGWYSVTVTSGICTVHQNIYVDEDYSCKVIISGHVYDDSENEDCILDDQPVSVPSIMVRLLPADIYTFTDFDGSYEFVVDTGAYTITYIENEAYNLLCPASNSIAVNLPENGMVSVDNNYFIKKNVFRNLTINAGLLSDPVPGYDLGHIISYCNFSENPEDITITFEYDPLFTDITELIAISDENNIDAHTANWYLNAVPPGECDFFFFYLNVPAITTLGTTLHGSLTIEPLQDDIFPENNSFQWNQVVVGSYDPNDKVTFTGAHQYGGPISREDSIMYYQIRFQNTGTDTAYSVVIRDTLDTNLDVETIRTGIKSHDYQLQFEGNNVLVFNFENIMLPDSNVNENASHGYVDFAIKMKPNLPYGTIINNDAAIYFDYNSPIITGTVTHILTAPVSISDPPDLINDIQIFPNPSSGNSTLEYTLLTPAKVEIILFSPEGKLTQRIQHLEHPLAAGKYQQRLDLSNLPEGEYFIYFKMNDTVLAKKIIKVVPQR